MLTLKQNKAFREWASVSLLPHINWKFLEVFEELAAAGVTSIILAYQITPLNLSVITTIIKAGKTERDDLCDLYEIPLKQFVLTAVHKYHPSCKNDWGGDWIAQILINQDKYLVEVNSTCKKNSLSSITTHTSTFKELKK